MKVLLVEDDTSLRQAITATLAHAGHEVESFESAELAVDNFSAGKYACIVSDLRLPGMDGIALLSKLRALDPRTPSLIMTAYGTIDIAVQVMKSGVADFIVKPFAPDELLHSIHQLVEQKRALERELGLIAKKDRRLTSIAPAMNKIMDDAKKIAKVDSSILIFGESGTGKELLARYIHDHSNRSDKPFVAINCAALPAELLESEFFGHEAGSFTGAIKSRIGLFEEASEGTIFLDEIGDMPKALQVKLLRVLQEKEIKRVGGNRSIRVTPRIIAATNYNDKDVLELGKLREDLYYRLSVMTFTLPPLRERKEDILFLTDQFIQFFGVRLGKDIPQISDEIRALLMSYAWPGNARELENVIERAVLMCDGAIRRGDLGIDIPQGNAQEEIEGLQEVAQRAVRSAETEAIMRALSQTVWNKSKAATILGVSYKTLLHKVKEYGLEMPEQHRSERDGQSLEPH